MGRSPFAQAADQRYQLQRFLARQVRLTGHCFAHAVGLTGCRVTRDLGPDAPKALILDAEDLDHPAPALHRVAEYWGGDRLLSRKHIEAIVALLKPTFTMTVVAATTAADTSRGLERETRRQVGMVESQIEGYRQLLELDRAVVLGGAGTGKTVMAVERAKQLARTDSRALLLCHRAGVRSFIITLLDLKQDERRYDPTAPHVLHVACWSDLLKAMQVRGISKLRGTALTDRVLEFRDSMAVPYDALVVDEGQEFAADQLEALSWLVDDPEASPLYVFADPFQHSGLLGGRNTIAGRSARRRYKWQSPYDVPTILLTTNCRNSRPIAESLRGSILTLRRWPQWMDRCRL